MKSVKLKVPLLIGTINHPKDATVAVPDVRAAELIRLGHATASQDGYPVVANPDHNALADVISPEPPNGLVINPTNALSPNIQDNPGLAKAVEIVSPKVKVAKVEEKTEPSATATEVVSKVDTVNPPKPPAPVVKAN
jgi:hypothetical protein